MTEPATPAPSERCAAHPVRRAVDRCPRCGRGRCAADAEGPACPACSSVAGDGGSRPAGARERAVRGALAGQAVGLVGGVVAAQYVGAQLFAYLTPFVVGVLVAAAAQAASGAPRTGPAARQVRLVASTYAVLGVALGFVLEQSEGVFATASLLPYAAAVAGVLLWTLPPKSRS